MIGDGDNETIERLKALLRLADCPNEGGINRKCVNGTIKRLGLNGYENYNLAMPCSFCTDRSIELGDSE